MRTPSEGGEGDELDAGGGYRWSKTPRGEKGRNLLFTSWLMGAFDLDLQQLKGANYFPSETYVLSMSRFYLIQT